MSEFDFLLRPQSAERTVEIYVVDGRTMSGHEVKCYAVEAPEYMGGRDYGLAWARLEVDERRGVAGDPVSRAPGYDHDHIVAAIRNDEVALGDGIWSVDLNSLRSVRIMTRTTRTDSLVHIRHIGPK